MKVEIYSDVVCPWCYIGHVRFARAAERYRAKGGKVEVILRPFQLQPDAESKGEPLTAWLAAKFGGPEQAGRMTGHVASVAAGDGLTLDFGRAVHANTFQAHRLVRLAADQGRGAEMLERLFRAHFTDGLDIGSAEVLAELAAETGVRADFDGPGAQDGAAEVREDLDRARALGVASVPLFLIEERFAVSGAQPEDALLAALEEVAERTGRAPSGGAGDACDDGHCAV
ncbi:DsbA family oxidoreductase [Planomonospora alba]|uniref:DsbA family oxidoreductase n=1 Tax=Planomonospora alba TaxID=161354 RepID=A0ABP6NVW4_9ACTN